MPASHVVSMWDGLEVTVTPKSRPDPVFFTDQAPEFDVTIHNNNSRYEWGEGSVINWRLVIDNRPVHKGEIEFGPLDNGEKQNTTIEGNILAYEGHGVIEITSGSATGKSGSTRKVLKSGSFGDANPAYSFSVWDASHYEATVRRPKKLQIALIITSAVLILFAILQILL